MSKRINTTLYFDEGSGNDKTDISIRNNDFQDNYDVMIPMTFECIDNVNEYFSKYKLL